MKVVSEFDTNKSRSRLYLEKYSIKKNTFVVSLLVTFILTFPLDAYRLKFAPDAINLSIARLAAFVLLIHYLIIMIRKIKISKYEISVVLFIGWSTVTTLINGRFGGSYEVMLIYSSTVLLVFYRLILDGNAKTLLALTNAMRYLVIILASFTIYTFIVLVTSGRPPQELPVGPFAAFFVPGHGHVFQSDGFRLGNLTRVAIPFSRPHDLGATAVSLFFAFILLREESCSRKKIDFILLLLLVLIIFLTGSRSIIFPFLLALILFSVICCRDYLRSIIRLHSRALISVSVALFLLVSVFIIYDVTSFAGNFSRIFLILEGASSEGHLNIRASAWFLATENLFFLFVGHGIGAFTEFTGASSAHSTLFNFLVDVGLVGVVLFLGANCALLFKARIFSFVGAIACSLVVAIIAMHFFYFLPTTIGMYVAIGVAAAVVNRRSLNCP